MFRFTAWFAAFPGEGGDVYFVRGVPAGAYKTASLSLSGDLVVARLCVVLSSYFPAHTRLAQLGLYLLAETAHATPGSAIALALCAKTRSCRGLKRVQ